jgi:hypothetical protein
MTDLDTRLVYHLPRTRVRITGTATEKVVLSRAEPERRFEREVALETTADPAGFFAVALGKSKLSDDTFSLELTEDGRLVSTEATSTGRLGDVVRNVFSFVTSVVGIAAGLLSPVKIAKLEGEPPAPSYEAVFPERAKRRRRVEGALEEVRSKVVDLEESLVGVADADERKKVLEHVRDLEAASTVLLEEARRLDVHFQAWKASVEQETTNELVFTLDPSDLPLTGAVESWPSPPTKEQLGKLGPVYDGLRMVLARRDVLPLPREGVAEDPGTAADGFFFRQPRPVELSLYVVAEDRLVLMSRKVELVMDEECRLCFVEYGKTRWSETSAEAAFWPGGSLKTLKNSRASEAAAATGALKELPADAKAALEQANQVLDERQKLDLQGLEHRIAELEKRKSLVEKEIALGGVVDTRQSQEEITRLKAEIDLLKSRKDLGVAERELQQVAAGGTLQLETEILKLRTALEQAQVERLKVQQALEKLASPEPPEPDEGD